MSIRAEYDPRFYRRFYIMGIVAIGFAFYCLYDGFIGYPAQRNQGFEEFKSDYKELFEPPNDRSVPVTEFEAQASQERLKTWKEYIRTRGIKGAADVVMQFVMAAISGLIGLFLLSIPLRARGQWIEMDNNSLRSSWGQEVPIAQIEVIDKRKWRDKGIAKIAYRDGTRKRRFILDDMKFMRDPTDEILFEIEQRIGIEKITNGPPEAVAEPEYAEDDALHASSDEPRDSA
jgi:hypothetical protein